MYQHVFTATKYFLLLSIVVLVSSSTGEALELTLKSSVTVNDAVICVRDILSQEALAFAGDHQTDTLLNTVICKAPQPGKDRELSRAFIVMKLKNKNIDLRDLQLGGAHAVSVDRSYTILSQKQIADAIEKYLAEHYSVDFKKHTLHFENFRKDLLAPSGTLDVRVEETAQGYRNNRCCFRLFVYHDGILYQKNMVSIKVLEKKMVVVAAHQIGARKTIEREDVVLKELDVNSADLYFTSLDTVVGKSTRVIRQAGDPITKQCIQERPLINKGDIITALFQKGNMSITLKVKALENGMRGDDIAVYSQSTKRHFSGKVLSNEYLEVLL